MLSGCGNGKIDKKALPKPVAQPKNLKEPQTPMQKKIFEIVADVVENDFFETDSSCTRGTTLQISSAALSLLVFALYILFESVSALQDFSNFQTHHNSNHTDRHYPTAYIPC